MSAVESSSANTASADRVCVRFWASARAEAGIAGLEVQVPGAIDIDALVGLVLRDLPDRPGLGRVLGICSVLVGDRPAGVSERATVVVAPGSTVEFLPPFAGG